MNSMITYNVSLTLCVPAVMTTEQGSQAVEDGVVQSNEAGNTIRVMADEITNGAQAAVQISVTSQQQLIGMDQVVDAMESIKSVSEQNVQETKQIEETVSELHNLGQRLKKM